MLRDFLILVAGMLIGAAITQETIGNRRAAAVAGILATLMMSGAVAL